MQDVEPQCDGFQGATGDAAHEHAVRQGRAERSDDHARRARLEIDMTIRQRHILGLRAVRGEAGRELGAMPAGLVGEDHDARCARGETHVPNDCSSRSWWRPPPVKL